MTKSSQAWRGRLGAQPATASGAPARRPGNLLARVGQELAEHPFETTALVTTVVALSRMLERRSARLSSQPPATHRRRVLAPLGVLAALCVLGLASCATEAGKAVSVAPPPESFGREYPENFAAAGRQLAQEQCAACHPIDHDTTSPNRSAPPLNSLLSRYHPDTLADDLIAGVWVGHAGMPVFDFNVIAADSLIAYLESIDAGRPRR